MTSSAAVDGAPPPILQLQAWIAEYPLARPFAIARGTSASRRILHLRLTDADGVFGAAAAAPYSRYGETPEGVLAAVEAMRPDLEAGLTRQALQARLRHGAARNALDCALWDYEARRSGVSVQRLAGLPPLPEGGILSVATVTLGPAEAMAEEARRLAARFPRLKLKLGAQGDDQRMRRIRAAVGPEIALIADVNEGWRPEHLPDLLPVAAEIGLEMLEQPLPAAMDQALEAWRAGPVPIYADESVHVAADLERLKPLYHGVNIKLDKSGGLTEALRLLDQARADGFGVMIGCMIAPSLAMMPALRLAAAADLVDLDGPLWLAEDPPPHLVWHGPRAGLPETGAWGASGP